MFIFYASLVIHTKAVLCSLQFQKSSEHSLFSNSVVDVFTQLTQCFDVVSKLECPDPEIWKRYMRRFAKTIVKVLTAYATIVKKEFPEHLKEERIVSIVIIVLISYWRMNDVIVLVNHKNCNLIYIIRINKVDI